MNQRCLFGIVLCLLVSSGLLTTELLFAQTTGSQSFIGSFPVIYSTGPANDGGEYSRLQYLLQWKPQWFDTLTQQTFAGPSLYQAIASGRAYIPYSSIQPLGAVANRYGTIMQLPLPPVYSANKIELVAHVKSTIAEGAIPARDVHMVLFGSSGNAEVNFVDSIYAEPFGFLLVGGSAWKNQQGLLVKQFDEYRTISIYLEDGKISLWLQGNGSEPDKFLFKDKPYLGAVGKVQGIALDFKGSASIDWLEMKSNGKVVMTESFDVPGITTATIVLESGVLMTGAVVSPLQTGFVVHPINITQNTINREVGKTILQLRKEAQQARLLAIRKANQAKITAQQQACEIGIAAYTPEYRKQLIDECKGITSAHTADPIDLSNGAMTAHETLISLPGVKGSRLNFDVSYNSRREYPSPVGYNRDHNHNITAYLDQVTNEFILQYDGSSVAFQPVGSQPDADSSTGIIKPVRFNPATRGLASLDVAGNLEINYPDRSRQLFVLATNLAVSATTGGELLPGVPQGAFYKIWIDQDADGNATTYHYDEYARLRMIVTAFDQSIVLMYNDQGQISKVFDSLGRSVQLSYTPVTTANGPTQYQLTSIDWNYEGQTRHVQYTYTTGQSEFYLNGNMISLIDSKGQIYVTNSYSSDDRVLTQQYGDEEYQYDYTLNARGGVASNTVLSANDSTTVYRFDEFGQVLSRETQTSLGAIKTSYEYDDKLRMISQISPDGLVTRYTYDQYHNLSQLIQTNTDGQSRTWTYRTDPKTRLLQEVTDPIGRKTSFTRDQRGRVIKIQQQAKIRQYSYDTQGQIVQQTDPMGVVQTMTYSKGRLTSITKAGVRTAWSYNAQGNLTSITDGRGNVWRIQLTPRGQISKKISPLGIEQIFVYDELNNLVNTSLLEIDGRQISTSMDYQIQDLLSRVTTPGDAEPRVSTMSYGGHQLLQAVVSPKGVKTTYGYDELDRLAVETVKAVEGVEAGTGRDDGLSRPIERTYEYDLMGRVISMTDPNGNKTTYEYDGRGQLSKVIDAQGGTRTMNYDTGGNVIEVIFTDAEDKILKHKRMEVDGYGRVVETVQTVQIGEAVEMGTGRDDGSPRPGEIITQYAYNLNDKLIKVTDPKGQSETMEYDALNRLVKQIDRLGNVTTKMYDGNGNIIVRSEEGSEEGQNISTSYLYDKDNRLIGTTNQLGQTQRITYNNRNQPISMTDAKGIITRYEYNNAGELKKLIRNDGKQAVVYTYQYDAHDNLIKLLDAKGNETKRDYDFLDRPVVLTYDDGKQLQYARDNNGNLISRTDPNGTVVTNSYDELNRLTQRDIQHGQGVGGVAQESYQYDGLGRLVHATDDMGQDVSFSYDGIDRLISETNNDKIVGYVYDNNSNLTQLRYPSGRVIHKTFDANNRTQQITQKMAENNTENIRKGSVYNTKKDSSRQLTIKEYRYDSLKLLSEINGNKTSTSYAYDELVRVKKLTHTTSLPNPLPRGEGTLESIMSYQYAYDAVGQITSDGWDTHSYDAIGQITKTQYNQGMVNGKWGKTSNIIDKNQWIGEWSYDAMGNRTKEASSGKPQVESLFSYGQEGSVVEAITDRQDISMSDNSIDAESNLEGMVAMNDEGIYDTQILLADNDHKKVENNQKKGEEKRSEENIEKNVDNNIEKKIKNNNKNTSDDSEPSEDSLSERCNWKQSHDKSGGGDGRRKKCTGRDDGSPRPDTSNKKDKNNDKNEQKKSDDRIDSEDNDDDDQKKGEKKKSHPGTRGHDPLQKDESGEHPQDKEPSESNREERCKRKASHDKSGGGDGRRKKCTEEPRNQEVGRDSSMYQYTTNTLNQYTSIQDSKGKTIVAFTYDANGNMISNGEFELQYDYKNRLIRAVKNENSEGPDRRNHDDDDRGRGNKDDDDDGRDDLLGRLQGMTISMSYDVLGRRVEKRVDYKANEGETVRYTYAGADAIQEDWEYDLGQGRNLKKELIYGQGIDDIVSYIVTRNNKSDQYRTHKNHQNSVIAITDSKGKVVESYRYDTFGNLIQKKVESGKGKGEKVSGRSEHSERSKISNDRLYTSREYDEELGLYYYRGRHYDPRIGRFIQRDPIGLSDDVNLYRYVGNSAVNYMDPWGLNKQTIAQQTRGQRSLNGLSSAARWTNDTWQSIPDPVQYRLEGAGQTVLGAATTVWGGAETLAAGGSCLASIGLTCVTVPAAVSDVVGGVTDVGKGLYGIAMGKQTTEGYYPVEEGIAATAGKGTVGTTMIILSNIDPKGVWKGIKNGFGALVEYGAKNSAQSLPPLQGKNLGQINQTLQNAGFTLKNPGNTRNQNRCHPDGSVCRVNPIGHPPTSTDPHLHKEFDNNGVEIIYDDYGNVLPDKYRPEAHIQINP